MTYRAVHKKNNYIEWENDVNEIINSVSSIPVDIIGRPFSRIFRPMRSSLDSPEK